MGLINTNVVFGMLHMVLRPWVTETLHLRDLSYGHYTVITKNKVYFSSKKEHLMFNAKNNLKMYKLFVMIYTLLKFQLTVHTDEVILNTKFTPSFFVFITKIFTLSHRLYLQFNKCSSLWLFKKTNHYLYKTKCFPFRASVFLVIFFLPLTRRL